MIKHTVVILAVGVAAASLSPLRAEERTGGHRVSFNPFKVAKAAHKLHRAGKAVSTGIRQSSKRVIRFACAASNVASGAIMVGSAGVMSGSAMQDCP